MELTCTSFSFPLLSFEDALRVIGIIGLRSFDVGAHEGDSHIQTSDVEADASAVASRINRASEAAGLRVSDFFATLGRGFRSRPVNTRDASERAANVNRFRSIVSCARQVGATGVTLLPGVIWDEIGSDHSFDLSVKGLKALMPIAHDAGLRLSFEAHLDSVAETPDRALDLIQAVPGLKLTLDYSHFIANGYQMADVHPLLEHAGHFHARQARAGFLQASHREGTLDFTDIMQRLKATSYHGDICIEYTWQEWRGANNVDVLMETIIMRDLLRQLL